MEIWETYFLSNGFLLQGKIKSISNNIFSKGILTFHSIIAFLIDLPFCLPYQYFVCHTNASKNSKTTGHRQIWNSKILNQSNITKTSILRTIEELSRTATIQNDNLYKASNLTKSLATKLHLQCKNSNFLKDALWLAHGSLQVQAPYLLHTKPRKKKKQTQV